MTFRKGTGWGRPTQVLYEMGTWDVWEGHGMGTADIDRYRVTTFGLSERHKASDHHDHHAVARVQGENNL